LYNLLKVKTELSGKSESTLTNYARCLAHLAMHYDCSPELLDVQQIESYLYKIKIEHKTPSESFFKHTVYGLRYVYKILGMKDKHVSLPSLEFPKKLPVVMSKKQVKQMLIAPKLLKHRLILGILYGCGLRRFELLNLELKDLDFDRKMLHIRQGKGRKDRYVPLPDILIRGLKKYIDAEKPIKWLFNGRPNEQGKPTAYSPNGIQWIIREARKKSGQLKEITAHTFRHSYATHLLEDGLDIMSIKDLLGHAVIETTLVYLHVAKLDTHRVFSPLDTLYNE
jgi:site-specific recombinase XerD